MLASLIEGIGAIPVVMTPEEHDMAVAGINHLPHVLAAALVNTVKDLDSNTGRLQMLTAGGFQGHNQDRLPQAPACGKT